MYMQLFAKFTHNLNKPFSHYETLATISTLPHYYTIYLIAKSYGSCSYGLRTVLSLLGPSPTPLQLHHEFQTSLPLTNH
jgi:hypothetical protein